MKEKHYKYGYSKRTLKSSISRTKKLMRKWKKWKPDLRKLPLWLRPKFKDEDD